MPSRADESWLLPFIAGFIAGFFSLAICVGVLIWASHLKPVVYDLSNCSMDDIKGKGPTKLCHY